MNEKTFSANTYVKLYNMSGIEFLKSHTKQEFKKFGMFNCDVDPLIDSFSYMPLTFKLFFFFLAHTEPGTNRIRHSNSQTQKITIKYLMDKFNTSKRSIIDARNILITAKVIKKYHGWYYFDPYMFVRYADNHHFYDNAILDLFNDSPRKK